MTANAAPQCRKTNPTIPAGTTIHMEGRPRKVYPVSGTTWQVGVREYGILTRIRWSHRRSCWEVESATSSTGTRAFEDLADALAYAREFTLQTLEAQGRVSPVPVA